ncbi:MAG: MBL fold metallo-hydrolase [Prevotella sp.]|nr:MBL fold metallo-hydrolase [Prevotella sp.]
MLKFISFGSGSSGNCYYLYTEKEGLIIDIGVGIRTLKKQFRDFGLSLSSIHYVLITHDHADHIKSVGSISHECRLPVYATKNVHDGIDRNFCVTRKLAPDMKRMVTVGKQLQLGDFRVTPFYVPHDATENVGYEIVADGVTFCIITDAGEITDEVRTFISRADYLVIEANHDVEMLMQGPYPQHLKERIQSKTGHLCNRDCGVAIAENMKESLKHVWLCHLSEENNHPELARKTVESVLREYGIIAGKDIQLEVLKRKTPTGIFELTDD